MSNALTRLLLVEDDARIASLLVKFLARHHIEVTHVADGLMAIQSASSSKFDVIVLDLMLPGIDGLRVCRKIRESSKVPIIMVTALGDESDRVTGLELGADDYMVKPISARELVARVRALLRRVVDFSESENHAPTIQRGDLQLSERELRANLAGRDLKLTSYEFAILWTLASKPGRIFSREQLMSLAKGANDEAFDRSVDVQVSRIRKKLGERADAPDFIRTVRGVGYTFVGND